MIRIKNMAMEFRCSFSASPCGGNAGGASGVVGAGGVVVDVILTSVPFLNKNRSAKFMLF